MPSKALAWTALFVAAWTCRAPASPQQPDAAELAQRFLAHIKADNPVAGTFEIRTHTDREMLDREQKAADAQYKGPVRLHFGPAEQTLVCRWAWDGRGEVCETLPGSKDDSSTFLRHGEGLLLGFGPRAFTLNEPRRTATMWRPACFYLLAGMEPWAYALADCSFEIGTDLPPADGEVTLIAHNKPQKISHHLTMERATCALRRSRTFFESKLTLDLQVQSLAQGPDQRMFPNRAVIDTYAPNLASDRRYSRRELTATKLIFPRDKAESALLMRLELPAGSVIADRVLNRDVELQAAASAADVIEGKFRSMRVTSSEQPHKPPVQLTKAEPSNRTWLALASAAAAVALVAAVAWRMRKGVHRS